MNRFVLCEIDECCNCPHYVDDTEREDDVSRCKNPVFPQPRKINYAKLSEDDPFPKWCPLTKKEDEDWNEAWSKKT